MGLFDTSPVRIGVFALSGPFILEEFEAGLDSLREAGFDPVLAPGIDARSGYLAGTDAHRLEGLNSLLEDASLELLMAARGGYGLHRLLPRIPYEALRKRRVVGFSDVTALHCARYAHDSGWGLHAPVVTQLPKLTSGDREATFEALREPGRPFELRGVSGVGVEAMGTLFGGNLALVTGLLGTPHLVWPEDTVLLIEDVGEATYRLDRMLTQLELSGLPARLRGVAVGTFEACAPLRPDHPAAESVLRERLDRWAVPRVEGLPIGHGRRNAPIPVGRPCRLLPGQARLEVEAA